jgi:hypothetical protein
MFRLDLLNSENLSPRYDVRRVDKSVNKPTVIETSTVSKGRKRKVAPAESSSLKKADDKEIEFPASSETTLGVELNQPRTRRQRTKNKRFS